jgi:hypothetical protein
MVRELQSQLYFMKFLADVQMEENSSSLESRLASVEDKLAIYNLLASHPLSADTGYGPFFPRLYTEDAAFDRGARRSGCVRARQSN